LEEANWKQGKEGVVRGVGKLGEEEVEASKDVVDLEMEGGEEWGREEREWGRAKGAGKGERRGGGGRGSGGLWEWDGCRAEGN